MRLGEFETMVYEQMIAEFPEMEQEGIKWIDEANGRTFHNVEAVVYYVCNRMWDGFDEALLYIKEEDKGWGK